jgi:acyl carrier protein
MKTDVRQFLIDAIAAMDYDTTGVNADTALGSAGIDMESLAIAELATQVEDEYKVKFTEEDTEVVAGMTVGELVDMIVQRAGLAKASGL